MGLEQCMADSRWSKVQNETAAGESSVAMDGLTFEKTPLFIPQVWVLLVFLFSTYCLAIEDSLSRVDRR